MEYIISETDLNNLLGFADGIFKIVGYAQGRAERWQARREDLHVIDFGAELHKKRALAGKGEKAETTAFLKTHKKEISKMKKTTQGKITKAIAAPPRYHKGVYEKRALIDGTPIYGCSADLRECEEAFLKDLAAKIFAENSAERKKNKPGKSFSEWAELWFRNVLKPEVTPKTYKTEYQRYERHIKPTFGHIKLKEIAPLDCIQFCNDLWQSGRERTTESCYSVLKRILQFAVDSDLIAKNPMSSMKPIKSERKNGTLIQKNEEKALLEAIHGSKYAGIIILALYTGARPCELDTAKLDDDFLIFRNRKQRNVKKIVYKKIPITPMLRPYLPLVRKALDSLIGQLDFVREAGKVFKEALPNHRFYDMRTTFATRCQECGVPETVVQSWLGHKSKTLLGNVYTKFSDDYLLSEGKKVLY